jgi:hypothetical protein
MAPSRRSSGVGDQSLNSERGTLRFAQQGSAQPSTIPFKEQQPM